MWATSNGEIFLIGVSNIGEVNVEAFLQVNIHNTSEVPPGTNLFSFCLCQGLSGFQVLLSIEAIGRI